MYRMYRGYLPCVPGAYRIRIVDVFRVSCAFLVADVFCDEYGGLMLRGVYDICRIEREMVAGTCWCKS